MIATAAMVERLLPAVTIAARHLHDTLPPVAGPNCNQLKIKRRSYTTIPTSHNARLAPSSSGFVNARRFVPSRGPRDYKFYSQRFFDLFANFSTHYNMLLTELGSSAAGVFSLPLSVFLPVCILLLSFSHFRLLNSIYISDNIYITYESIFLHLYNLDRYFLAINYFFKSLTFLQIASS